MRVPLLALLSALTLTGCASSNRPEPLPPPPPAAPAPIPDPDPRLAELCGNPPVLLQSEDGTMTAAQALANFQALYQWGAECSRRQAGLVTSWPR